jgi:DNA-binding GntR family transcriptional regulator
MAGTDLDNGYSVYMTADVDLSVIEVDTTLSGRRTTADYVADAMRQAINSGKLADGAVLNQAELAEHFGVSRVPVREAMRQLQAEGLIESRAHRVALVKSTNLERLLEVFALRALLEGWLIEQAVQRIDAETIAAARDINERLGTETDHSRYLALNAEFHHLLYEKARAEVGLEMLEPLRARSERYTRLWSQGPGLRRPEETATEHAEILRLIEAGDAPGARAAVEAHVLHTRQRVVEAGRAHQEGQL